MSRGRFVLVGLGLALAATQAGHLLAYELRYGSAAMQMQSLGAHAYFPAVVKTGLGAAAAVILVGLLVVGFARVAVGRPIPHQPVPSYMRLVAFLYTVQLACFVLQEAAEAAVGGAAPASPAVLLLWGTVGQLPVALVAALTLRWLLMRLGPALAQIRLQLAPLWQRFAYAATTGEFPLATDLAVSLEAIGAAFSRRSPPF